MNQMVAMVMEKKRSSSMSTLTSAAVRMKSSSMKIRLPAMRMASETLHADSKGFGCGRVQRKGGGAGGAVGDL